MTVCGTGWSSSGTRGCEKCDLWYRVKVWSVPEKVKIGLRGTATEINGTRERGNGPLWYRHKNKRYLGAEK